MATTSGNSFFDRIIERVDRIDPANLQTYVLRLVREKGFLETIFNTIEEGVVVIDSSLKINYMNRAGKEMFGIQDDPGNERIDRYLRDVDWGLLLDADPDQWERFSRQEIEILYPVHRYISFYLVPIKSDLKKHVEEELLFALILRDVSQLRQDRAKAMESQKVQAITTLAAGVAHELGNPLNSLNIHLQLLGRTLENSSDPEVSKESSDLLTVAKNEVNRLDSIVKNFLQAVRPATPEFEQTDVRGVITGCLKFMREEIEGRDILVETTIPSPLPAVMADPDHLKQAFYNIIKNAIQAMPEGGRLQIGCRVRKNFLDIRFADTGQGISRNEIGRIMDPYYTTKSEGTGLGLLIVERIVRSHGGEMGIESGSETGAAFTISLPLRERRFRLLQAGESPIDVPVDMNDNSK